MKYRYQLPLILRTYRTSSSAWIGIEWRSFRYRPRIIEWEPGDISGMLKSYDD